MELNNPYTRIILLILGLTLTCLGFFTNIKLSVFGLMLWVLSTELFNLAILKDLRKSKKH